MQVQPYLFFDGRCEEAVTFYRKALGAGQPEIGEHGHVAAAAGQTARGLASRGGDFRFEPFRFHGLLQHHVFDHLVLGDAGPTDSGDDVLARAGGLATNRPGRSRCAQAAGARANQT